MQNCLFNLRSVVQREISVTTGTPNSLGPIQHRRCQLPEKVGVPREGNNCKTSHNLDKRYQREDPKTANRPQVEPPKGTPGKGSQCTPVTTTRRWGMRGGEELQPRLKQRAPRRSSPATVGVRERIMVSHERLRRKGRGKGGRELGKDARAGESRSPTRSPASCPRTAASPWVRFWDELSAAASRASFIRSHPSPFSSVRVLHPPPQEFPLGSVLLCHHCLAFTLPYCLRVSCKWTFGKDVLFTSPSEPMLLGTGMHDDHHSM